MIPRAASALRLGLVLALWRRYRAAATPSERETAGRAIIAIASVWVGAVALTGLVVFGCVAFLLLLVRV
ncbi:hypothetical protein [Frondihabitans peucedani]|uniref:Uncharacterized protein n=1 Tax=Frondihabitans peucedani TaxID=598626 RepID=A0ABP8E2K9_9MICO